MSGYDLILLGMVVVLVACAYAGYRRLQIAEHAHQLTPYQAGNMLLVMVMALAFVGLSVSALVYHYLYPYPFP